ncbi:hypothetical protein [Kitasatospora sp. NPDC001095]
MCKEVFAHETTDVVQNGALLKDQFARKTSKDGRAEIGKPGVGGVRTPEEGLGRLARETRTRPAAGMSFASVRRFRSRHTAADPAGVRSTWRPESVVCWSRALATAIVVV